VKCPPPAEVSKHLKDWGAQHLRELADRVPEETLEKAAAAVESLARQYGLPYHEVNMAANLAYYDFLVLYG
jgi:hypothetical protein